MIKYIILLFISLFVFFASSSKVLAQSPSPQSNNSFEIFWPLSAGKTKDDSLYFLKSLKEKVRGLLIFGEARKADYQVFLGTKRLLESEKLIYEEKYDLANQTIEDAKNEFTQALDNYKKAKESSTHTKVVDQIRNRVQNLIVFLPTLREKSAESRDKLSELEKTISEFSSGI